MGTAYSLPDLLLEHLIKPKSYRAGHNETLRCPKCEGGRTREFSLSVKIDEDGHGATWQCHRGSCGWRGGERLRTATAPPLRREIEVRRPTPHADQDKPQWMYDYFEERGIGPFTVDAFGIYVVRRRFPLGERGAPVERDAIVFPYRWRGDLVNRKYRPYPEKSPQLQDTDALPTLFNIDSLAKEPEEIVFVEGEPDVMACYEVGYRYAVTLKDGAPSKAKAEDDPTRETDKRFAALDTHAEQIAKAKRIILAGDNDAPGLVLREELARRFGRHRCFLVEWPDGCKDANEVLIKHGEDVLKACIIAAKPYPIEGVRQIQVGTLLALRKQPPPPIMTTGTMVSDEILSFPAEGRLVVVTGYPNHGKTTWTRFVMVHTAANHDRRWLAFSPESQPWEQFAAQCAEVFIQKPFWKRADRQPMSDIELAHAEAWLSSRIFMLVCDAEDETPTLDWILDRARICLLRHGITDLLIDPWNEIEHARGNLSETEYIGRSLQRLRAFGLRHGCNVWIVAHPKAPQPLKPGDKRLAPTAYDINGSANWANKADLGVTIHSPESMTQLHLWKSRYSRWGRRGAMREMYFQEDTGCYFSQKPAEVMDGMDV